MAATLLLTDIGGATVTEAACIGFRFVKERYTPYTLLTAAFLCDTPILEAPAAAQFSLDGVLLHHGSIDTLETKQSGGKTWLRLVSHGFSAQLLRNEMAAGTLTNVTLQSLMAHYAVPNVTYEAGIDTTNYVWIKEGSSQWEAICSYAYKYNQGHPYIRGTNTVQVTIPASPPAVTIPASRLIAQGVSYDYSRILSTIHMADAQGNPDAYSLTNPAAAPRGIVRHRQIPLELQYAYNPADSLVSKVAYSMRGHCAYSGTYEGYEGEDLEDLITLGTHVTAKRISRLEVRGGSSGITTQVGVYFDSFCKQPAS